MNARVRLDVRERLLEAGVIRPAEQDSTAALTRFGSLDGVPVLRIDDAGRRAAARAVAKPVDDRYALSDPLLESLIALRERGRRATKSGGALVHPGDERS